MLHVVLRSCSDNKILPVVLLDLLNHIYNEANCSPLDTTMDLKQIKEHVFEFATNQRVFSYKELFETMELYAKHFQHERLQHGLHGLYPIYTNYIQEISLIFRSYGYALVVSAIHVYPGSLANNCE